MKVVDDRVKAPPPSITTEQVPIGTVFSSDGRFYLRCVDGVLRLSDKGFSHLSHRWLLAGDLDSLRTFTFYCVEGRMKRQFLAIGLLAIVASLSVGCTRVGPGYVGIKVSMAGDSRGVDSAPAVTGWAFYNPMLSSVYEYPTFVQTAVWTKSPNEGDSDCDKCNEEISFTNADNMKIDADISLSYHLEASKVPAFYVKFRNDNLRSFTHGYLRNVARDQFNEHGGKYRIDAIMGDNGAFVSDVRRSLQAELAPIGVVIDQFGFIGAPRPPQGVVDAINGKIHATQLAQQKQNELVQAQADAAKEVAKTTGYAQSVTIRANAESAANKLLAASITPELVRLKQLEKWDGRLPQINGGSVNPFISIEK